MELGADLTARLRAYTEADCRSVDTVVADAVAEYLGTHPNHERVRATGLAAMREYEAEYGPFTEAERAEAAARIDWLMGPADGDQRDPRDGEATGRSDV